jgi:hypothetical protein
VIDDVGHVRNVVRPLVRDRYVPAGAVGFQRRDGEARAGGDGFEAAVPRLTRRRSTTAVQIEHEGKPRATVIARRHEQPVGALTLAGYEPLLDDAGRVRQIARRASRRAGLRLRVRRDPTGHVDGDDGACRAHLHVFISPLSIRQER